MVNIYLPLLLLAEVVGSVALASRAPAGCDADHVAARQLITATFGVAVGLDSTHLDTGDFILVCLAGIVLPAVLSRNAELRVRRTRGDKAAELVRRVSYFACPAIGVAAGYLS